MERPVLPAARELGEGPPQDARPPRALRGVGYQAGEVTGGLAHVHDPEAEGPAARGGGHSRPSVLSDAGEEW